MSHGPQTPISDRVHAYKYRGPGESFKEAATRVAGELADGDEHFQAFRDLLLDQRFLPGGRIQAGVGTTKRVTPFNCYVSGEIQDSLVTGGGSIHSRFGEALVTMRMGGGIGYDFSTLRPRGAEIRKLGSRSSGPVSFMGIFDAGCQTIASAGERRGAQMGVMRVDHPDIEEFVRAKHDEKTLTNFNVSVGVTDEFMRAVDADADFDLRFDGVVHRTIRARALWDTIMRSAWEWAEPGVLFLDTINGENNLWYCERIVATNPCGEQPLPPFGACLLGSFNLVKYLRCRYWGDVKLPEGEATARYELDFAALRADVAPVVRAMDNVIDIAHFPLHEQEQEARRKRRMGLGVTGVANAIEALGHHYGSEDFCAVLRNVLATIRDAAYQASVHLAIEKGPFPAFDRESYGLNGFAFGLPEDLRRDIRDHGTRNSHLLSIAPTGTISLCADNISSGIEPVFDYEYDRRVETGEGKETVRVKDYGAEILGIRGKVSRDVTPKEHVAVLAAAAAGVDSAVSKTCNVPNDVSWDAFKDVYVDAWLAKAKGCTVYREGSGRAGIFTRDEGATCRIDETGRRECE